MYLSPPSLALAARQLAVPTFSESSATNAIGFVSIPPMPTPQTELVPSRPFTMGHGPVVVSSFPDRQWTTGHGPIVVSTPTSATESSLTVTARPFTLGHGPIVLSTMAPVLPTVRPWATGHGRIISPKPILTTFPLGPAESAVPDTASTLATVIKWSPTTLNTSATTHRTSRGYSGLYNWLLTDCHQDDLDYTYFTLRSPNGSLALDSKGKRVLYYISTKWRLSYPKTIRKALFDDQEPARNCPDGHCVSKIIPGTNLRLEHVRSSNVFRAGWNEGHCGYTDNTQTIGTNFVVRGKFGYLHTGVTLRYSVIAFVEQQLLATFPTLEIGLILGFTVVLFVGLPLLVFFWRRLCRCIEGLEASVKGCSRELGARVGNAVRAVSAGTLAGVERRGTKIQNVFWMRTNKEGKHRGSGQGGQVSEVISLQHHAQLAGVAAPPPPPPPPSPAYQYVDS